MQSLAFHNGGLSDLFEIIGHSLKEMAVGTMHRTALNLSRALDGARVTSYCEIAAHPKRAGLDAVLDDKFNM